MKRTAWLQSLLALSLLALLSCDAPETLEEQSDAGAPSDTTSGTDAALDAVDDASLDDTADAGGDGPAADTELIPDGSGDPDSSADAGADTSPLPCSADADCPSVLCLLDAGSSQGICALPCGATSDCNEGDLCLTIPGSALLGACVAPDYCRDLDGDLAGAGPGCTGRDCDDSTIAIGPGVAEQCDGVDQDCDGAVDEEAGCSAAGESCDVLLDCAAGLLCDAGLCLAPAVCGDGSQGGAEQCDDGNLETERCSYGAASCEVCDSSCALVAGATSRCGDGERNLPDEACDSGAAVDLNCAYGERSCLVCNAFCSLVEGETSFCGDGVLSGAERCDDGNSEQTDGCGNDCSCSAGFHLTGTTCEVDVRSCLLPNALVAEERWNGISYDTCAPVSCNPTYHLEGGSCRSDERSCSLPDAVVAVERWTGAGYGPCTASACAAGLHVEAGACVSNQRACSQPNATAAVESWTGTEYAGCTATACEADFHLESGACLSDTRSCSLANAVTAVSRWNGGSFGTCEAVSCVTEYHVEAQQCLFDLRACTAANATFALERWSAGAYRDCAATACIANYHVEGGACEPNTRSCTADAAITGEQYWLGSGYSVCAATSCLSGYHLESNSCLSDLRACTAPNADTATQAWNGTGYGPCTPSVCTVGFHLEGGACTSDQRSCSIADGTGSQSWTGSSWGGCIAASCTLGFHVAAGQCESDVRSCLSPFATAASEVWTGTGFGPCTPSACLSGYHLEAGLCAADLRGCPLQNATFATQSWTGSGYGACVAVSCTAGYHVESATCRSDTQACALANGTGSQQWLGSGYGACTATACNAGYHIESAACASDIRSCGIANGTGSQTWNGAGYGTCAVTACNSSYHIESGACASDIRSCGVTNGTGIQTWTGSAYGTCTISACDSAYHIESGVCVSNTRSCTIANGTGIQSWTGSGYGSCRATVCDTGFVAVAGSCVQAGLQQLGGACSANGDCISGSCSIDSGGLANAHCVPSGMVWVPSGTFQMGAPESEGSGGNFVHEVTLTRPHFADATEVTQGSWKALASGLNPSFFSSCGDSCPVEQLDWYSALAYANARSAAEGLAACYTFSGCADFANGWKDGVHGGCTDATFSGLTCTGYRLPTEAEWEFAARAGTTTATWLGGLTAPDTDCVTPQPNLDGIGWWCRNSVGSTRPSGLKLPNPWGLKDTLGNVGEWTGDWFASYNQPTQTDPLGSDYGLTRVIRGGSWFEVSVNVRAAARSSLAQDGRSSYVGLRVARSAPQLSEGALCRIASSCESGVCSAGACAAPTCSDGVKNAAETGVDCGGPLCGSCAVGVTCLDATDCATGRCEYGLCRSCSDGLQTGAETGVDCGGVCVSGTGGGCARARACLADGDCSSGRCFEGRCGEDPRCFDGVQNGLETAVDCGGLDCTAKCVVGTACTAGAQCATGNCAAGFCATAGDGGSCYAGTDCQSRVCAGSTNYEARSTYFGLTGSLTDGTLSTAAGDTGSEVVPIPFTFTYFGSRYNAVAIHADGFLTFQAPPGATTPRGMPNATQPNAAIAWMWRDNNAAAGSFRYATLGTAPYRRFIVNAAAVSSSAVNNAAASAQVILYETTNRIEIQCATCATSASAIVQGIENGAGTAAFGWNGRWGGGSYQDWSSTAVLFDPNAGLTCQAPTTSDGVTNGTETDVDCGGASGRPCGSNAACSLDSDCQGGQCLDARCQPTADGTPCSANGDCASGYCDGIKRATSETLSLVGALSDGTNGPTGDTVVSGSIPLGFKFRYFGNEFASVKLTTNGLIGFASPTSYGYSTENNAISVWTGDMNAGAGQIKYQTIGTAPFRKFIVNYNSLANYYAGPAVQAQAVLHESLNYVDILCVSCGMETSFFRSHYLAVRGASSADILELGTLGTSGSTTALPANSGYRFVTDPLPTAGKICAPATCRDALTNGTEPSTDCGGSCGADCSKGAVCSAGTDCISGSCSGGFCAGLADAAACTLSGSCDSGLCVAGTCAVPACNDAVKNGAETATDCGGGTCSTCAAGLACSVSADCSSNRCDGGLCSTCTDNIKSGTETDVDCGGVCVSGVGGKCSLTKGCTTNEDCSSANCLSGVCASPIFDCFDGIKDYNEAGVDCGGSDCGAKCLTGTTCALGSDCATGVCTAGICAKAATGGSCLSGADCTDGVCAGATAPTATAISFEYNDPTVGTGWTAVAALSADDALDTTIFSGTFNFKLPATLGGSQFNSYAVATANSNGWFGFGSSTGLLSSTVLVTLPSATLKPIVGLYAADSGSSTAANNGTMRYKTFGTAPFRKYVYDITNHPSVYNSTPAFTAQIVLYETLNTFDVLCKSCGALTPHVQGFNPAWGANAAFIAGRNNAAFQVANDAVRFNPAPGLSCQAPTATDGLRNGTETDVDCGGSSGKLCGFNLVCAVGSDCKSAECNSGLCAKSATGEACAGNADCLGANCTSNICSVGGGGSGCLVNGDCASANCDTTRGSPGVCSTLAEGASCAVNGDCQSNFCAENGAASSAPGAYPATFAAVLRPSCATVLASGSTVYCTTISDAGLTSVRTLPFAFTFFDVNYTQFKISADGTMTFDTTETAGPGAASVTTGMLSAVGVTSSETLPTTAVNAPGIALYQLDGAASATNSVRYWYEGTAGDYVAYITFEAVPHYNGAAVGGEITGVVILNQADNSVELQIEAGTQGTTAGARARGIRNVNGSMAHYLFPSSTHYDLTNENGSQFAARNSRVKYLSNAAPKICTAAGSRGAPCAANADCGSNSCVPAASSVALTAPGVTPPASFWASGFVANTSATTTIGYPTITGTSLPVALGFPMTAFNQKFTDVRLATSGYISFLTGTATSSATGANLLTATTTSQNGLVAFWWRANNAMSATNNVKVVRAGTAPNRTVTFDANLLTTATTPAPVKARVVMYERSNLIDVICYACGTGTTTASYQGIESPGGTIRVVTQNAVTTALQNSAVRFNPNSSAVCF